MSLGASDPASSAAGRPGVIVDRDGTLIDFVRDVELGVVTPAFHPDQLRLMPGVEDGLRALREAGFALAMATNQPGAAKGQLPREAIERTQSSLVETLARRGIALDAVEVCLHHPTGGAGGAADLIRDCECRKPRPGMLQSIIRRLGLDPARTWMVGDTTADLRAAQAAGVRSALLFEAGRCELCPLRADPEPAVPTPAVHAAEWDGLASQIIAASGGLPTGQLAT